MYVNSLRLDTLLFFFNHIIKTILCFNIYDQRKPPPIQNLSIVHMLQLNSIRSRGVPNNRRSSLSLDEKKRMFEMREKVKNNGRENP